MWCSGWEFKSYWMLGFVGRQLGSSVFKNISDVTSMSTTSRRMRSAWSWKWIHYNTSERQEIFINREFIELQVSSCFIVLRQFTERTKKDGVVYNLMIFTPYFVNISQLVETYLRLKHTHTHTLVYGIQYTELYYSLLTFRHRASCFIGQAFRYYPENAFYIFNQQIYFIIWYLLDRASLI